MYVMSFPQSVAERALVASSRCCCICHKFCSTKIELHHIKQRAYGGEDTFENCIPLCFDCHADMGKADPNHPKGKHYSESELIQHRDLWYKKIEEGFRERIGNISDADKQLFDHICQAFSGRTGESLRDEDLRGAHARNSFDTIYRLQYDFLDPVNEFIDAELEKLKGELQDKIKRFTWCESMITYPIGTDMPDHNATHLWLYNNGYILNREVAPEKLQELEKQFEEEAEKLNDSATELWNCYCDFVRQGRRIINS